MSYDPNQFMIKLKGKDYLPVQARLCWFRDLYPDGTITTHITHLDLGEKICVCHARVESGTDGAVGEGIGSESARDFGDYIEKSSTKAVGRALLALGLGTANAADELDEGQRIVDSPVERRQPAQLKRVPSAAAPAMSRLDVLKTRAKESGWIVGGNDREALRASWDARMAELFGGHLLADDYGKASVLGQIEASIELYAQAQKAS